MFQTTNISTGVLKKHNLLIRRFPGSCIENHAYVGIPHFKKPPSYTLYIYYIYITLYPHDILITFNSITHSVGQILQDGAPQY